MSGIKINLVDFDIHNSDRDAIFQSEDIIIFCTDQQKQELLIEALKDIPWEKSVYPNKLYITIIGCSIKEAIQAITTWITDNNMTYRIRSK